MIKFKGFDDWIPIFQGGSQTDSAGRVHDVTALIEKAVSTFNAARHEPPVVIGHPMFLPLMAIPLALSVKPTC
ncbi:MAG: hypothetical protein KKH02_13705 [Proteobacteria bacterium]|nr:hypothetical protein [Pseudomonadota bacterium]MCG2739165.1 hypothetical protein [Syntrophaceae bacterium]MBU1743518.1 hypothetical protein [Pseudomonadota bacterium]MBU1964352.1 hypothetical protein [Pseudomonadota bacterium]MBU4372128.1 hypothetical protein [Pseudomonadota bacterium]